MMKKYLELLKKAAAGLTMAAVTLGSFGFAAATPAFALATPATPPNWDASGTYVIDMVYQGTDNPHDMVLAEDASGAVTGHGGSPAGANTYMWTINPGGSVMGDALHFTANYTATADAVNPQTVLIMDGTVANDGTISGTWSDNYQAGARGGTWHTTSGAAVAYALNAEDFGVMNQSGVKGYTAGFGLSNSTFANAQSVVVKLYSGATLLQTDTLGGPNASSITGNQISAPFDVFGNFDYAADGYWTNVRGSEYGQTMEPTSVVADVTLANGKMLTATNSNAPTGNRADITPAVQTMAATNITASDATLNATNGPTDAQGHSFWASLAPFSTDSPTLPAGVYSTPDLGMIAANAPFMAQLSSVSGLPAVTASTTYYFAGWVNVGGTWHPGSEMSFATAAATSTGTTTPPSTVKVTIIKFVDGAKATASSSMSLDFPMTATYSSTSTGSGTGTYALSAAGYNGDPTPYQAKTADMTAGASYSTNEITGGSVVGASCSTNQPFMLAGYSTGDTLEAAMAASSTMAIPAFANMTNDKYVIVWNKGCSTNGNIGGTVTGGVATSTPGVLKVTGVTAVKTTATADGTFANGWKYVFHITVPTNETHLAMKFADWASDVGSTTLPVANNMRISSAQAASTSTVLVTAANTYTTPDLNMTGDLDPATVGKQVDVTVEVAVPSTTVNGSYTTSYGVKTQ